MVGTLRKQKGRLMKKIYINYSVFTFFVFFSVSVTAAAPRVVVSIAPLHSLMLALMEGAAEPILLYDKNTDSPQMDAFQKSLMITADMLVWVGSELESPVAESLDKIPVTNRKVITLSKHMPLLAVDSNSSSKPLQLKRDPRFWSDPRLAIVAVQKITPELVRLDPEHQELYLDNEITLIKKLRNLEKDIAAMLSPLNNIQVSSIQDQYFSHRFITYPTSSRVAIGAFQKVSNNSLKNCVRTKNQQGINFSLGVSLYFDAAQETAKTLATCAQNPSSYPTPEKVKF